MGCRLGRLLKHPLAYVGGMSKESLYKLQIKTNLICGSDTFTSKEEESE